MLDNSSIMILIVIHVAISFQQALCTETLEKPSTLPQLDNGFSKRNWKSDMAVWGKRGWNGFHSADWGKRSDDNDFDDLPPDDEYLKRMWQKFEADGWGKPNTEPLEHDYSKRVWKNEMPLWGKRGWNKFNGDGWGKRSDTNELEQDKRAWKEMPLWGKRAWRAQPAAWGKRSDDLDYAELDGSFPKRSWKSDMGVWGKRGQMDRWTRFQQGSWGKRSGGLEENSDDKRAWNDKLHGDWGKRFIPSEDDLALQQLDAAMDEGNIFFPTLAKRAWGKKADKWEKFRGTWGKRSDQHPRQYWSNLRGIWGKRNIEDNPS